MEHVKPNVLISACIEHKSVRFDGTMISDPVVKVLKDYVNFIHVCPEMAIGMPAPRDSIRLVRTEGNIELVASKDGTNYTDKMKQFSSKFVDKLKNKDIDGFILKAKSPTCGTDGIKVYKGIGKAMTVGSTPNGLFADEVVRVFPNHVLESERRLSNFTIRENFYIHIFTIRRFKEIRYQKMGKLVDFHKNHKYLFMAYNQTILRELGNIVANPNKQPKETVYDQYEETLYRLLKKAPQKQKRINVLTHIYGYFKDLLSPEEKAYYFETQNDYLNNHLPFSSPLKILQSFVIRFNQEYLKDQVIFNPYPKQLLIQLDSGKKI